MEDIFGELIVEIGLDIFYDLAADGSNFSDASTALSDAGLVFDSSSIFGEATVGSSIDTVQILDPFSDLDDNGFRDSLQVNGLDLDGNGTADKLQFNTDADGDGTSDALQFGTDLNNNGLADQSDIGVDSDGDGVLDSAQSTGFDLDGNGFNDVASKEDVITIYSSIPPKWF